MCGDMTDYFRFVTKLTFPNISDAELWLISSILSA